MMKKEGFPFRLIFIVVISLIVFSFLIWLYNQSQNEVLHQILTYGICLGILWLVFLAMTIYGVVSNDINERKNRIYQAQEPERLKQHQARFYCHICGKPSPKPYQYWDDYGENGQLYSSFHVTDYNIPTELIKCTRCQKWTCANADPPHLEKGVCKKCLEHTSKQVQ
jgi:hypothetical protein